MSVGVNSDTWWKAVGNEPGGLANVIDNRVRAANNIIFTIKGEVPRDITLTHTKFVCDYFPLKSESFRVRLTVGRNRLEYPGDVVSPSASILESKILFNSTISYAQRGARFLSCDMKYFSWKHPYQERSIRKFTQNISHQTLENYIRLMYLSPKMYMFTSRFKKACMY